MKIVFVSVEKIEFILWKQINFCGNSDSFLWKLITLSVKTEISFCRKKDIIILVTDIIFCETDTNRRFVFVETEISFFCGNKDSFLW